MTFYKLVKLTRKNNNQKGGIPIMYKKWMLGFSASILALGIMTGCAANDDMEPMEDEPLDQEENNDDTMDEGER